MTYWGGSKSIELLDGWYYLLAVANLSAQAMLRAAAGPLAGSVVMGRPGSITGVLVKTDDARTAGTLTVEVYKNGSGTGLTSVLNGSNTVSKFTRQAEDVDAFTTGDEVSVRLTTDGSWAPVTANIRAAVEVSH